MKTCPICDNEKFILPRIIYNGQRICRDCFNSPAIKYCPVCMEYYHIGDYLVTQGICIGCYDSKHIPNQIQGGN